MNNKKKLTIILAVFAVICVFAVLVFSGVINLNKIGGEEQTTDASANYVSDSYKNDMTDLGTAAQPYLPTNIQDIYYSISKDGKVSFFKYENKSFTPVEATGKYKATVQLSMEDVSAEITYYSDGGKIAGFGVYNADSGSYHLTPYAFFRLTGYGSKYDGRSSKSCLLLIDTTADDFYSANKVYEESFIFNYADSKTSRSLSEANRTVGMDGAKRADYFVINDTVINNSYKNQLFFSGRQYSEEDPKVDLLRSGGSGNNTDNINIAQDVLCNWVKQTDEGILFLTVDDSENVILARTDNDGKKTSTIKTFEDIKRDDILVSGDCIYFISKNTVYDIAADKQTALSIGGASSFKADTFVTDGNKLLVRGYTENLYPTLITASADGSSLKKYTNEFFRSAVNPVIASDGSIIITAENNGSFNTYIF